MPIETRMEAGARWRALSSACVLLTAIAALGVAGSLLGVDGNYDLRNYHYYAGWALLHKTVGFDLAPGQLQTYHHPLLDGLYYLTVRALNHHPLRFTAAWAIPQAVAVWISYHIARLCLATAGRGREALAILAAVIGAGGATSVGVVGTSMSDGVPNACILGAIWIILSAFRREKTGRSANLLHMLAGILAGAAAVLKLTTTPYLIAFGLASPATLVVYGPWRTRLRGLVMFSAGTFVALAVLGGPWWLAVYRAFDNPLFPYYNALFRSPLYDEVNFFDTRFLPRTPWEWLTYPLEWTLRKSKRVSEEPVRDLRILLELLAALAIVAAGLLTRRRRTGRPERWPDEAVFWCAAFALFAYVIWLKTFSILRYASGLETISGVLIVIGCGLPLARLWPTRAWPPIVAMACTAGLLISTTVIPTWERRHQFGGGVVSVEVPKLPPDATVLLLVAAPASYVAAFEPPSVRFIGLNNNLLPLNATTGLQAVVERAIANAPGSIWGLDKTDDFFGQAEQTLARYHFRRTEECSRIASTVDNGLRICRLERTG